MKLVIGVDPHKETHTAVGVVTGSGELFGELTVVARPSGYEELLIWAVASPTASTRSRSHGLRLPIRISLRLHRMRQPVIWAERIKVRGGKVRVPALA